MVIKIEESAEGPSVETTRRSLLAFLAGLFAVPLPAEARSQTPDDCGYGSGRYGANEFGK